MHLKRTCFAFRKLKCRKGRRMSLPKVTISFWNSADKKANPNGCFFKTGTDLIDTTSESIIWQGGRVECSEFEQFLSCNVYTPILNANWLVLIPNGWEDDFSALLEELEQSKPIILCGYLNVAHREIDPRIPVRIAGSAGLPMRSAIKWQRFCKTVLLIHSDTFTRIVRAPIPGGPIWIMPERIMQVGELTISLFRINWSNASRIILFTPMSWAVTIARSNCAFANHKYCKVQNNKIPRLVSRDFMTSALSFYLILSAFFPSSSFSDGFSACFASSVAFFNANLSRSSFSFFSRLSARW